MRAIVAWAEDARVLRAALCAGRRAGLTPRAGAVWMLPATPPADWPLPIAEDAHGCSRETLLEMADGHLAVGGAHLATEDGTAVEWTRRWREICTTPQCGTRPPPLAPLLYDSLRLAETAVESLREDRPEALSHMRDVNNAR